MTPARDHAQRTMGIRMTLLTTERRLWQCADDTAEPKVGDISPILPIPYYKICMFSVARGRSGVAAAGLWRGSRATSRACRGKAGIPPGVDWMTMSLCHCKQVRLNETAGTGETATPVLIRVCPGPVPPVCRADRRRGTQAGRAPVPLAACWPACERPEFALG